VVQIPWHYISVISFVRTPFLSKSALLSAKSLPIHTALPVHNVIIFRISAVLRSWMGYITPHNLFAYSVLPRSLRNSQTLLISWSGGLSSDGSRTTTHASMCFLWTISVSSRPNYICGFRSCFGEAVLVFFLRLLNIPDHTLYQVYCYRTFSWPWPVRSHNMP